MKDGKFNVGLSENCSFPDSIMGLLANISEKSDQSIHSVTKYGMLEQTVSPPGMSIYKEKLDNYLTNDKHLDLCEACSSNSGSRLKAVG